MFLTAVISTAVVRCGPGQVIPYAPPGKSSQPGRAGFLPLEEQVRKQKAAILQEMDQLSVQRSRLQVEVENTATAIGSLESELAALEQQANELPSQALEQRRANLAEQSAAVLVAQAAKIELETTLASLESEMEQRERTVQRLSNDVRRLQAQGMIFDELSQKQAQLAQASRELAATQSRYFDAQQTAHLSTLSTTAAQFSEKDSELRMSQTMEEARTQVQQQIAQLKEQHQAKQVEHERLKNELEKQDLEITRLRERQEAQVMHP